MPLERKDKITHGRKYEKMYCQIFLHRPPYVIDDDDDDDSDDDGTGDVRPFRYLLRADGVSSTITDVSN
jgi:hypothetical protein